MVPNLYCVISFQVAQKEHEIKGLNGFLTGKRETALDWCPTIRLQNGLPSAQEELPPKKGCIATLGAIAEAADELHRYFSV